MLTNFAVKGRVAISVFYRYSIPRQKCITTTEYSKAKLLFRLRCVYYTYQYSQLNLSCSTTGHKQHGASVKRKNLSSSGHLEHTYTIQPVWLVVAMHGHHWHDKQIDSQWAQSRLATKGTISRQAILLSLLVELRVLGTIRVKL